MNLKDLFDKAPNGTLTWDQLVAAAGNSKFVDLTEGNYVDKQKHTDELAARDTRINTLNDTIATRDTDLANLQEQLKAAGTDAEKLASLQGDLTALQSKYDTDTKAYQQQLADQAYEFAVKTYASGIKFTSKAAKKEFIRSMLDKKLKMEGEAILGAEDFRTAYAKDNEDSFVVEQPDPTPEPEPDKPKPHFAGPTGNEPQGAGGKPNPFKFNFAGVRPHEK